MFKLPTGPEDGQQRSRFALTLDEIAREGARRMLRAGWCVPDAARRPEGRGHRVRHRAPPGARRHRPFVWRG